MAYLFTVCGTVSGRFLRLGRYATDTAHRLSPIHPDSRRLRFMWIVHLSTSDRAAAALSIGSQISEVRADGEDELLPVPNTHAELREDDSQVLRPLGQP